MRTVQKGFEKTAQDHLDDPGSPLPQVLKSGTPVPIANSVGPAVQAVTFVAEKGAAA